VIAYSSVHVRAMAIISTGYYSVRVGQRDAMINFDVLFSDDSITCHLLLLKHQAKVRISRKRILMFYTFKELVQERRTGLLSRPYG
jgi:hypothetical protein